METKILNLPYKEEDLLNINEGDLVLLNGFLYVGRDQVHKLLSQAIINKEELPFKLEHNAIYYMGPSPTQSGKIIGSCGPTTSARMDKYSPLLAEKGLKVMVGKGPRSKEVKDAIKQYNGLYLQAFGGCGSLYASKVISKEEIAYSYLGAEALILIEVKDFPTICMIDGKN